MVTHNDRGGTVLTLENRFTTYDDYVAWADTRPDEERYEVVDGLPIMSPGPSRDHQRCIVGLTVMLHAVLPAHLEVLVAPFDWVLWEGPWLHVRQPDVIVTEREDDGARGLRRPPVLAVEVLSPTSMERDLVAKRRDYARAGLQHYWIVDPEATQLAVYRLVDGELELAAQASGHTELRLDEPFPMRFKPTHLMA